MKEQKKLFALAILWSLLACVLFSSGCVERKLTINTQPQGALVLLNDEEIGTSPVTVEFNWSGDYKVLISKEGFQTINTHRKLAGPMHDRFPVDFFYEVLWPATIVDEYEWTFKLDNYQLPDKAEIIADAAAMKKKADVELAKPCLSE